MLKRFIIVVGVVGLLVGWIFYWSPRARSVRTFDRLEESVKKVITPSELQTWATNLLAQYPDDTNLWVSQLGTNFPSRLRKISPRLGPQIYVTHWTDEESNRQDFVTLDWGGGILGHSGFKIGSTNYDILSGHKWKEGVYFIPAH